MDKVHQQQLQDVADSAYARQIWWEMRKELMKIQGWHPPNGLTDAEIADEISLDFQSRCAEGFFDVKRQDQSQ
jgi:hypothetical protein